MKNFLDKIEKSSTNSRNVAKVMNNKLILLAFEFSRCFNAVHIQTARRWEMAIENKPGEAFDTVFSQNDSLERSSHHDHETGQARVFKIIVIGDSNVGKTCLTYRFCGGTFLKNPEATIGVDFRERTLELDGESIKVRGPTNTLLHFNVTPHLSFLNDWHGHLFEPPLISGHRGETDLEPVVFRHSRSCAMHGDSTTTKHRPTSLNDQLVGYMSY